MTKKEEITIRKAELRDMTAVHELVKELAVYEKAGKEVNTSPFDYENAFNDGLFEVIVAELTGEVIGMVLFYDTYSTWKGKMIYLEDFVVKSAYRRLGVGQLLFDAFLEAAREKKATLVKWQVLDWNEPALAFYYSNNAIIEQNWWNGKLFL